MNVVNFTEKEIFELHKTSENQQNLGMKAAKIRVNAIINDVELYDFSNPVAQRLIDRLCELERRRKERKLIKDRKIQTIKKWEKFSGVQKLFGVALMITVLVLRFIPSVSEYASSTQLIPGALLVSKELFEKYRMEKEITQMSHDYIEKKHGLENERAAILVELAPHLPDSYRQSPSRYLSDVL